MDYNVEAVSAYNKVAQLYSDKFMDLDLYDDVYSRFCDMVRKTEPEILEIGCGPGNATKKLLQMRPDLKILGIDAAEKMIELAAANNPAAEFEAMDCRNISKMKKEFDGIFCGFCMPYLSEEDCSGLIKDCADLLSSGGILYTAVIEKPENSAEWQVSSNGDYKMLLHYYSEKFLTEEVQKHGFDRPEIIRKSYRRSAESEETHLILIARKS